LRTLCGSIEADEFIDEIEGFFQVLLAA